MKDIAINFVFGNGSGLYVDISVVDRETLAEDLLDLFGNGMTLVNREVRIHLNHNIKIDVATIRTATLLLNLSDFWNLKNGFFIGLEVSLVETV